jgi:hypothetical protein
LSRKAGIAQSLQRSHRQCAAETLSKAALRSFAAKQKPIVANPSYAAYTWVSVGVEVLISRAPLL